MTSILIDSNILLDIVQSGEWARWSATQLNRFAGSRDFIINQLIYAEVSSRYESQAHLDGGLTLLRLVRETIPWNAAYLAGRAHAHYRQNGGSRERTLPDFLIGAHALVMGHTLLTRDARRYRAHFPQLSIIAPDTHP